VTKPVYGTPIGTHLGRPIFSTVETEEGKKYVFDRLAECDHDGCPLDQLARNEILFRPGLIYRPV
jgi:hypothetical protein